MRSLGMLLNGQVMHEWSEVGDLVFDDPLLVLSMRRGGRAPLVARPPLPKARAAKLRACRAILHCGDEPVTADDSTLGKLQPLVR